MTLHLSSEQLDRALAGDVPQDVDAHLAACTVCAARINDWRAALGALPSVGAERAHQPDGFWRAQRLAISARVAKAPGQHARVAWTLAFASLLLFGALLNRPADVNHATAALQPDPDDRLLMEVEASVRRRVPDALAPAELLVAEMDSALKSQGNP